MRLTEFLHAEVISVNAVADETEAYEQALEILSLHLVEFDTIKFSDSTNTRLYYIEHLGGKIAPVKVLVEK